MPIAIYAKNIRIERSFMSTNSLSYAQLTSQGLLQAQVVSAADNRPIPNAIVTVSYEGTPDDIIEETTTDLSGQTEEISLAAPPLEYSLEPGSAKPYANYILHIQAEGFESLTISGSELLPDSLSIQPARLVPLDGNGPAEETPVNIQEHTLYAEYPEKIPEAEVKPITTTGEIVLSRVVVPETIVVHDGVPSDSSAPNYYVPYTDYIKNVASSEIYATWTESAIMANVLAIQSFAMNRIYTEWYRNI